MRPDMMLAGSCSGHARVMAAEWQSSTADCASDAVKSDAMLAAVRVTVRRGVREHGCEWKAPSAPTLPTRWPDAGCDRVVVLQLHCCCSSPMPYVTRWPDALV